ncbi:MAG: biotin/lipoyl-containing protein [Alphaproteobacteria bacterium]
MAAMVDVQTDVAGSVWKIVAREGDALQAGETVLILESMKMEIPVDAPAAGTLAEFLVEEGETVEEGQTVARLQGG